MKDCADNIQRLERDPVRFDVLDLFDAIGRSRKYEIGNINDNTAFVGKYGYRYPDIES